MIGVATQELSPESNTIYDVPATEIQADCYNVYGTPNTNGASCFQSLDPALLSSWIIAVKDVPGVCLIISPYANYGDYETFTRHEEQTLQRQSSPEMPHRDLSDKEIKRIAEIRSQIKFLPAEVMVSSDVDISVFCDRLNRRIEQDAKQREAEKKISRTALTAVQEQ